MKTYHFIKNGSSWYIDLPEYLEKGGSIGDLQMVEGADTMLDIIASENQSVTLMISERPFAESDVLTLVEKCDPDLGGGYYLMKEFENTQVHKTMWLCQVTEFVFGSIPSEIYVKRM